MKRAIAINVHSFVDVITNSSSELFVCDTDKSMTAVKQILSDKLRSYNRNNQRDVSFEDAFREPYIFTQEMLDNVNKDWSWGWEKQENVGKIIIRSIGDNSIPWEIVEWIESAFSARRWHLG